MRGWISALAAVAGLSGADGVALAAAGAHLATSPFVTTGAYFLLIHAGALVALTAAAAHVAEPRALCASATLIAVGVILFSGDLALRGLAGVPLFPFAAPTGGLILIAGWLGVAVTLPIALGRSALERPPREQARPR